MSNEMITKWEDAGRDCGFCGGEIYKRTDIRSSKTLNVYYECQECAAQWTFNGSLKRASQKLRGKSNSAVEADEETPLLDFTIPTWVWVLFAVFATYIVIRLGFGFIRYFVPLLLIGVVCYLIYRVGQDQEWW